MRDEMRAFLAKRVWSPHRHQVITMAEVTVEDAESMAAAARAGLDPEDLSLWPVDSKDSDA